MSAFSLQAAGAADWTQQDTIEYLNDNPLPADFVWQGKTVVPAHRSVTGYGKWLKETPYHRGCFPLVHRIMAAAAVFPKRSDLSQNDGLVAEIRAAIEAEKAQTSLFD